MQWHAHTQVLIGHLKDCMVWASVVRGMENAIHLLIRWITIYPLDSVICPLNNPAHFY